MNALKELSTTTGIGLYLLAHFFFLHFNNVITERQWRINSLPTPCFSWSIFFFLKITSLYFSGMRQSLQICRLNSFRSDNLLSDCCLPAKLCQVILIKVEFFLIELWKSNGSEHPEWQQQQWQHPANWVNLNSTENGAKTRNWELLNSFNDMQQCRDVKKKTILELQKRILAKNGVCLDNRHGETGTVE